VSKERSFLFLFGSLLFLGFVSLLISQPFQTNTGNFLWLLLIPYSVFFASLFVLKKRNPELSQNEKSLAILIILFSLLFRWILLISEPSLSDDIFRYAWDGRVLGEGINPYSYAPSDSKLIHLRDENYSYLNHPSIKTIYPPLAQVVFWIGAKIREGVGAQRFLFLLFDVLTLLLVIWLLDLKKRSVLWSIIYGWNPLVVIEFASSGHLDSLMLSLIMFSLVLLTKRKNKGAQLLMGLSILAKWIPFVWIPWILIQKKFKETFLFFLIIGLGLLPFFWGVGETSSGLKIYAKEWVFNPSFYGLLKYGINDPKLVRIILGTILVCWPFE